MNWEAESVQFTHEQSLVRVFREFNFPINLHLGKEVEVPGAAARWLRNEIFVEVFGLGRSFVGAFVGMNDGFSLRCRSISSRLLSGGATAITYCTSCHVSHTSHAG